MKKCENCGGFVRREITDITYVYKVSNVAVIAIYVAEECPSCKIYNSETIYRAIEV